jgi:hypothetical protein
LRGPNWKLPFHIYTDASDKSLGVVLGQKETLAMHAIYYINKNLAKDEQNYTVTEKEFLAVVYAINKFHHYITRYPTFVHTDHSTIKYLVNKPVVNGRIIRWLLLLQEFDITILDKPGRENVVVYFLSRVPGDQEDEPMDDSFPDEHLFVVSVITPWFANIANYLVSGRLPQHFSYREHCALVRKSGPFTWIKVIYSSWDLIKFCKDVLGKMKCMRY